jgi:hypothetical protein
LVPERNDWIGSCRASGRNVGHGEHDCAEHDSGAEKRDGIRGLDAEERAARGAPSSSAATTPSATPSSAIAPT